MYAYFELYKGARLDDDQLPIRCTKVLLLMFSKGKIQIFKLRVISYILVQISSSQRDVMLFKKGHDHPALLTVYMN